MGEVAGHFHAPTPEDAEDRVCQAVLTYQSENHQRALRTGTEHVVTAVLYRGYKEFDGIALRSTTVKGNP